MHIEKQKIFLELYEACHEPFTRYCSALSYGKLETADLIQDVMLSAYKNFNGITDKEKFLHYLIRAAKNISISHWRKQKNKVELIENHTENLKSKEVPIDTLLEIQFLYKMIHKLPESQKHALILFEISGFSMKEIAEIQSTTVGAVKTKISRGRQYLKQLITKENSQV